MSSLKKHQDKIVAVLLVISIPFLLPLLASCIDIVLKAGRIIGTIIRIY